MYNLYSLIINWCAETNIIMANDMIEGRERFPFYWSGFNLRSVFLKILKGSNWICINGYNSSVVGVSR